MSLPWLVGNSDDFRERPAPMGTFEAMLLIGVLATGAVVIGAMTLTAWFLRPMLGISQDPNGIARTLARGLRDALKEEGGDEDRINRSGQ